MTKKNSDRKKSREHRIPPLPELGLFIARSRGRND
jgi:hypothetical protein